MKYYVMCLFFFQVSFLFAESSEEKKFSLMFNSYISGKELDYDVEENAKKTTFHFVQGFLNEKAIKYFATQKNYLSSIGVPKKQILDLNPNSNNAMMMNVDYLQEHFIKQPKHLKRHVIIAHSKGAVETLLFFLKYPEFITKVDAVVLVQGSFNGSPIANCFLGKCFNNNNELERITSFEILKKMYQILFSKYDGGLKALTHHNIEHSLKNILKQYDPAIKQITKKIFYVTGSAPAKKVSLIIRPAGYFLDSFFGENDGLVLKEDQIVPEVGTVLFNSSYDHLGLILPKPLSNSDNIVRIAFMESILEFITKTETIKTDLSLHDEK